MEAETTPPPADRSGEIAGVSTHWLEARAPGAGRILYLHGVPTASWDWASHLERTGGVAPDLPAFGSSASPHDFDHTMAGYGRWLEVFVDELGLERFSIVGHDWGGTLGLILAQRFPERIERLVLYASLPLLPGYRWHWAARIWRRPILGELFMATSTKSAFRLISRQSNYSPGPMPRAFIDRVWADFDRGERRAILGLYRSADPDVLARAGERLGEVRCPALVLWPTDDPYIGPEWGPRFADALGGSVELEMVERAGHWPWVDRPEIVERAAAFLGA